MLFRIDEFPITNVGTAVPTRSHIRSIYDGRYKFARYVAVAEQHFAGQELIDEQEYELYDTWEDPYEIRNLANDPGYGPLVQDLLAWLYERESAQVPAGRRCPAYGPTAPITKLPGGRQPRDLRSRDAEPVARAPQPGSYLVVPASSRRPLRFLYEGGLPTRPRPGGPPATRRRRPLLLRARSVMRRLLVPTLLAAALAGAVPGRRRRSRGSRSRARSTARSRASSGRRRPRTRSTVPSLPANPALAPDGRSGSGLAAGNGAASPFPGPLGVRTTGRAASSSARCTSLAFDAAGRLLAALQRSDRPVAAAHRPRKTLATIAFLVLPPRPNADRTDTAGGTHFIVRADGTLLVPTHDGKLVTVAVEAAGLRRAGVINLKGVLASGERPFAVGVAADGRDWVVGHGRVGRHASAGGQPPRTRAAPRRAGHRGPRDGADGAVVAPRARSTGCVRGPTARRRSSGATRWPNRQARRRRWWPTGTSPSPRGAAVVALARRRGRSAACRSSRRGASPRTSSRPAPRSSPPTPTATTRRSSPRAGARRPAGIARVDVGAWLPRRLAFRRDLAVRPAGRLAGDRAALHARQAGRLPRRLEPRRDRLAHGRHSLPRARRRGPRPQQRRRRRRPRPGRRGLRRDVRRRRALRRQLTTRAESVLFRHYDEKAPIRPFGGGRRLG